MASTLRELKLNLFLLRVHRALMCRYAKSRDLPTAETFDLDWFAGLPPSRREQVATELEKINHICRRQDRKNLIEMMARRKLTRCLMGDDPVEALDGVYDVAFLAFVVHRTTIFDPYYLEFVCSRLEGRVRYRAEPGPPVNSPEEIVDGLQLELEKKHAERYPGGRCLVEPLSDGDTLTLLVSYETYKRSTETFKDGERSIEILRYRPLRRELATYDAKTGLLELKANRGRLDVLRIAVAECLFLESEHFDRPVVIDLTPLLGLREAMRRVGERDVEQVTGVSVVFIAGALGDGHSTVFTLKSDDVFASLDDGVCLHESRTLSKAMLEFTYDDAESGQSNCTARIGLATGANKLDKPEAGTWPEDEIMETLEAWGLVKIPPVQG